MGANIAIVLRFCVGHPPVGANVPMVRTIFCGFRVDLHPLIIGFNIHILGRNF